MYYNEERKKRYIEAREQEVSFNRNYLPLIFERTCPYEKKYGKDLCEFTTPEIEDMLKTISYTSVTVLIGEVSQFAIYTDWCLAEGFVPDSQNHFREIKREDMSRYLNTAKRKEGIVTPEDLLRIEIPMNNPSDKALLWLVFEGFTYAEIQALRISDIHRESKTVDTCNRTGVVVSSHLIELMFESAETYDYYPIIGDGEWHGHTITKLENDDHIIKRRAGSKPTSEFQDRRRVYARVLRILNTIGDSFITSISLKTSGFVWHIKQEMKKGDDIKKFYGTESYKEIAERYGKQNLRCSELILRYGDFFKEE